MNIQADTIYQHRHQPSSIILTRCFLHINPDPAYPYHQSSSFIGRKDFIIIHNHPALSMDNELLAQVEAIIASPVPKLIAPINPKSPYWVHYQKYDPVAHYAKENCRMQSMSKGN
jgi:hypothetical protein